MHVQSFFFANLILLLFTILLAILTVIAKAS